MWMINGQSFTETWEGGRMGTWLLGTRRVRAAKCASQSACSCKRSVSSGCRAAPIKGPRGHIDPEAHLSSPRHRTLGARGSCEQANGEAAAPQLLSTLHVPYIGRPRATARFNLIAFPTSSSQPAVILELAASRERWHDSASRMCLKHSCS
jgi:hypothetical protein